MVCGFIHIRKYGYALRNYLSLRKNHCQHLQKQKYRLQFNVLLYPTHTFLRIFPKFSRKKVYSNESRFRYIFLTEQNKNQIL